MSSNENFAFLSMHTCKTGIGTITFNIYYNRHTPIFIQLRPFLTLLKYIDPEEIIKTQINKNMIKTITEFNDDETFKNTNLPLSTEFVTTQIIDQLVLRSKSEKGQRIVEHLHHVCFEPLQEKRLITAYEEIVDLRCKYNEMKDALRNIYDILSKLLYK